MVLFCGLMAMGNSKREKGLALTQPPRRDWPGPLLGARRGSWGGPCWSTEGDLRFQGLMLHSSGKTWRGKWGTCTGCSVRGVLGLSAPEKSHFTVVSTKIKVTQKIYDEQNAKILNKDRIGLEGLFSLSRAPGWLVIAWISSLFKILFFFIMDFLH